MFQTKVTDMLGIEYPIVGGTMMWITGSEFTAAIANAGGLGVLASAIYQSREEFGEALNRLLDLTDKPLKCYEPRVYLSLHAGRTTICYPIEGMNPTKGVSPMTTVSCRKSDCDCAPAGVA